MSKAGTKNLGNRLLATINRCPTSLFIFGLLCLNFLSFVSANNEEQYLLYAKHFANPDWLSNSFIIGDFSGNRLVFEMLFGWMVETIGFEKTVFFGRLLNFLLLSIPMAAFFKLLKINNVGLFLVLQIFILADQTFYAGEWVFGSIESKSFAYIFVFYGLVALLRQQYYRLVLFLVGATYFHILVGGWFAVSCFGFLALQAIFPKFEAKKLFLEVSKYGILYVVALLPLLYYLATNLIIDSPKEIDGINLNYIYVYFRNKHHIGLFYSFDYFFQKHAWKVLLAIIAFVLFYRKKDVGQEIHLGQVRQLMLVMLGLGFFFVGLSWLDNVVFDLSGGFLLKSYPFRMQSMAFLIFLSLVIYRWQVKAAQKQIFSHLKNAVVFVAFLTLFGRFGYNISLMYGYQSNEEYNALIHFIKNNTAPDDAILLLEGKGGFQKTGGHLNQFGLDLIRRTERDNFVHFKFVPTKAGQLYEWYRRLQLVERAEENPQQIRQIMQGYGLDYVLTKKNLEVPLEVVFENEGYRLYRM